jgi:hypothetical protein
MKNLVVTAILLSSLTSCAHAPGTTQGAAAYVQPCNPYRAQAAYDPAFGYNGGILGGLAKALVGLDSGACSGYVQPATHQSIILPPPASRSITCFDLGSGIISCS